MLVRASHVFDSGFVGLERVDFRTNPKSDALATLGGGKGVVLQILKEASMEILEGAEEGGLGVSPNARLMQPNVIFMCCNALHCIELHCELL